MSKAAPVPAETVQATASTETMTNEAQEVAPIVIEIGCTMGPITVTTLPPTVGEFVDPTSE